MERDGGSQYSSFISAVINPDKHWPAPNKGSGLSPLMSKVRNTLHGHHNLGKEEQEGPFVWQQRFLPSAILNFLQHEEVAGDAPNEQKNQQQNGNSDFQNLCAQKPRHSALGDVRWNAVTCSDIKTAAPLHRHGVSSIISLLSTSWNIRRSCPN